MIANVRAVRSSTEGLTKSNASEMKRGRRARRGGQDGRGAGSWVIGLPYERGFRQGRAAGGTPDSPLPARYRRDGLPLVSGGASALPEARKLLASAAFGLGGLLGAGRALGDAGRAATLLLPSSRQRASERPEHGYAPPTRCRLLEGGRGTWGDAGEVLRPRNGGIGRGAPRRVEGGGARRRAPGGRGALALRGRGGRRPSLGDAAAVLRGRGRRKGGSVGF